MDPKPRKPDLESGHQVAAPPPVSFSTNTGEEIALTKSQKSAKSNEGSSLLRENETTDYGNGHFEYSTKSMGRRGSSIRHHGISESIRKLRSAAMSVSLLEKPSEDRRASAFMAGWNISNLIQGTGILGVPYAVRMGGWAGVVAIAVVAWVCCFTGKLLVDCLYEESKRTGQRKRVHVNYPEVGEAAWPGWGNKVVSVVQCCEMYGGVIMYIVLLATIFNDMLQAVAPLNIYTWAVVCAYCALPGMFITRVSVIAWISMLSVFSLVCGLLTIIIYCFTEFDRMSIHNIPSFDFSTFPIGFGIIVFSYCAHAVFPGVEGSMKEPERFPMMMNVSFFLAAMIKVLLGLLSVLRFGQETEQVITVNMKSSMVFNYLSNAFVVTNVFLAFPICMYVVLDTWDTKMMPFFPHLQPKRKFHWFWLLVSRSLLLTFALFLSVIVPHFGLLMGLVGSFTGTFLSFVFPCVFHLKLKWKQLHWYSVVLRIMVIIFGLVCGSMGLFFSGRELGKSFSL